jgi:hypothetical protein
MEQAQHNGLAVLLHLLHLAREAQSPLRLGFIMVNESRQLLVYRQAAFWQEGCAARLSLSPDLRKLTPRHRIYSG